MNRIPFNENRAKFLIMLLKLMPVLLTPMLLLVGCEDSGRFRHDVQPGYGALVVDNITGDDLDVFIDGVETNRVRSGSYRVYDLVPGVYRLVLDGRRSDRLLRDDVDILDGRLTIQAVYIDVHDHTSFRVVTRID